MKNLVLGQSSFEIKGVLGSLDLSSKELVECYEKQTVIPIKHLTKSRAVVELNKHPILAADIGETSGLISLKIEDSYSAISSKSKKEKKSFSQFHFGKK